MYSTALTDDLREAAATFGDAEPLDEWEARRRELAAFYALHKRQPRRWSLHGPERRLAVWAERQAHPRASPRRARYAVLLQLTPGWQSASPASPSGPGGSTSPNGPGDQPVHPRRSTYRPAS